MPLTIIPGSSGGGGGSAGSTSDKRADAENFILNGQPAATFRESIFVDRADGNATGALTSGVMFATGVPCFANDVIAKVGFMTGTTGAGTPTNWWFAIYDQTFTFQRQSADQTTTAWAGNTAKELALSSSFTVPSDQIIYACVTVVAATVPVLRGYNHGSSGLLNGLFPISGVTQKIRSFSNGTGLTTTAPAGTITPSAQTPRPYAVLMS